MTAPKGKRLGREVNRKDLADTFGVSLPTVDDWVSRGCPIVSKGRKGVAWVFNTAEVAGWREQFAREGAVDPEVLDNKEIMRRTALVELAQKELEFARDRETVATIEEFEAAMVAAYSKIRGSLRLIPPRCASKIGALKDEAEIAAIIRAEVDKVLEALSDADLVSAEELQFDDIEEAVQA